jgi:hypothetical protein
MTGLCSAPSTTQLKVLTSPSARRTLVGNGVQLARSYFSDARLAVQEYLQLAGTLLTTILRCDDPSFTATDRRSSAITTHRNRNENGIDSIGTRFP